MRTRTFSVTYSGDRCSDQSAQGARFPPQFPAWSKENPETLKVIIESINAIRLHRVVRLRRVGSLNWEILHFGFMRKKFNSKNIIAVLLIVILWLDLKAQQFKATCLLQGRSVSLTWEQGPRRMKPFHPAPSPFLTDTLKVQAVNPASPLPTNRNNFSNLFAAAQCYKKYISPFRRGSRTVRAASR